MKSLTINLINFPCIEDDYAYQAKYENRELSITDPAPPKWDMKVTRLYQSE